MSFGKSFWLPKIPCLFGVILLPINLWYALLPYYGITWFHILLTIAYAVLNAMLIPYLFQSKKAESLVYAALHWLTVFAISVFMLAFHDSFYTISLELMLILLPVIGQFIPLGYFDHAMVVGIALTIYAGVLFICCLIGIYMIKHRSAVGN